ncbi:alpha/beta-hydrolase [Echria macrotheca]|uniref:Alpha/beta-hydrolase n=1 Tax=Echria macrotheca TaxID=438768 RepID=A0AAJ0B6X0_9PEZI|nr:alpha/beta-hydrolase [Echria macrotheca]
MSLILHVAGPSEGSPHTHTVVLLHGRDSKADEFASEFFECEATGPEADRTLPALFPTIRWVFPQANPLRAERFDTDDMSQWFDVWTLEDLRERSEIQISGLRASVNLLLKTIQHEELLVPRNRIFLGGISQGFATSLAAFFADGRGGFAGLCGFCSWLPLEDLVENSYKIHRLSDPAEWFADMQRLYRGGDDNRIESELQIPQLTTTPILLEHARDDPVISVDNCRTMRKFLGLLGFRGVEWHEYDDGEHWINEPQGVDDFVGFLRRAMVE